MFLPILLKPYITLSSQLYTYVVRLLSSLFWMLWIQSELNEPKHVAEFLIVTIDYQNMLCLLTDQITVLSQNTTWWLLSKLKINFNISLYTKQVQTPKYFNQTITNNSLQHVNIHFTLLQFSLHSLCNLPLQCWSTLSPSPHIPPTFPVTTISKQHMQNNRIPNEWEIPLKHQYLRKVTDGITKLQTN